jgi:hypothetical protein
MIDSENYNYIKQEIKMVYKFRIFWILLLEKLIFIRDKLIK